MRALPLVIACLAVLAVAAPAHAQLDVGVLKPLGARTESSIPAYPARLPDGTVLFSADDGTHGRELWRTDGTAAGTALVADLIPGPTSGDPFGLTTVEGVVYFQSQNALWRTDGTAAGTRRIAPFHPWHPSTPAKAAGAQARASEISRPGLHPFLGGVAFNLYDEESKLRVVRSTADSMREVDVLPADQQTGDVRVLAGTGAELIIQGTSAVFRTDGTVTGTRRITDLDGVGVTGAVTVGGYVILQAGPTLRALAPGAAHTAEISDWDGFLTAVEGVAYFGRADGLYRWTPGMTPKKVGAGKPWNEWEPFGIFDMAKAGDDVFWVSTDAVGHPRLFSAAGQVPGPAFYPSMLTAVAPGRVVFWAWEDGDATNLGATLWAADRNGMRRISAGGIGGRGWEITPTPRGVVLAGADGTAGTELMASDGTPEGTRVIADINRWEIGSEPSRAARVGDRVVFGTYEHGALWVTDGTAAGTTTIGERGAAGDRLSPQWLTSDGTTAYFVGTDSWLYRSDGTADGTRAVAPGFDHMYMQGLGRVGNAYVFSADRLGARPEERSLWRTDGTQTGTRSLGIGTWDLWPGSVATNEQTLVFRQRYSLVSTDGETAAEENGMFDPVAVPGGFLAGGWTSETGRGLFALDAAGRHPRFIRALEDPERLVRVGDRVLLVAGGTWDRRWHSANLAGGDVRLLSAIEGQGWDYTVIDGIAYVATRDGHDVLLYRTDGTDAGTTLLHRFADLRDDDFPSGFAAFAGSVWFRAYDAQHGDELWRTDGTPQGTGIAADIVPGPGSSQPLSLVATDDFLFFSAYDLEHGVEPWVVRRAAPPEPEPGEHEEEPQPPVTIAPVLAPERAAAPPGGYPLKVKQPTVSVQVKRLKARGGVRRWRVTGTVRDTGCSGRVRVELARVKTVTTPLKRCRFTVTVTSRTRVRSIVVRTVPSKTVAAARSRAVRIR